MSFNLITGRKASDHVTSKQFRDIMRAAFGGETYIPDVNDKLEIIQSSSNSISVLSGMLIHHGCVFEIPYGDSVTFTIDQPTEGVNKTYGIYVEWQIENGIESARIACDPSEDCPTPGGNMQEYDSYDCVGLATVYVTGLDVNIHLEDTYISKNEYTDSQGVLIPMSSINAAPTIGASVWLPAGYYVIQGYVVFQAAESQYLSQAREMQVAIYCQDGTGSGDVIVWRSMVRISAPTGVYAKLQTMAIGYFPEGLYEIGAVCTTPCSAVCDTQIRAMRIR